MLRWVAVAAAVVVAVVLGAVQLASSAAYGDLAARHSLPAFVAAHAPGVLYPLLDDRARVRVLLAHGDAANAKRVVDAMGASDVRDDLAGQVDEAVGERAGAVDHYVRARDVVRAQALIDDEAPADPRRAVADQERLVAGLGGDPGAAEVTGEAWWRLGQLRAAAGYADAAHRATLWRSAEDAYERALRSAPNEETYLLAAGYQSLANGDAAAAQRFYARAAEVVPDSADARAGLAWTAAARGDCAAARAEVAAARALRAKQRAGAQAAVRDPADDPQVGAPLRRCGA